MKVRDIALCAAAAWCVVGLTGASAKKASPPAAPQATAPVDLTVLPPVPHDYKPKTTGWGDPDLRGIWPIDSLGGLPLQRTAAQGNRVFLTDEEFAASEARMEKSRNAAAAETKANKLGMGNWVEMTGAGRRTSLLVDPANGRLPPLTDEGKRLQAIGRSSWVRNQTFDWVTDFDSWDRCISRGFPRLDAAVPLQQRHPDLPGAGLRGHQPGDDPRRAHHPAGRSRGAARRGQELDGRKPRSLGGHDPW